MNRNKMLEALANLNLPECQGISEDERTQLINQMILDLKQLAFQDGWFAAGFALSVFNKLAED